MDALPGTIAAPVAEVAPDGRPRGELVWHGSPLSACAIQVQDGIDDFAYVSGAGMASWLGGRDERFQDGPFLITQITGIASSLHLPTSLPFFFFVTSFPVLLLYCITSPVCLPSRSPSHFMAFPSHLASGAFAHSLSLAKEPLGEGRNKANLDQ